MAAGARDHVSYDDLRQLRHLELVSLREFSVHRHLRELRATQKRLDIFESRHQELISGTNDAVAHIQEGILSDATPSFAPLLGYADAKPLIGKIGRASVWARVCRYVDGWWMGGPLKKK